jgi:hypothetical protein
MEIKINQFTQHEWNHMHDCILIVTWKTSKKKCSLQELMVIFEKLPEDLKEDAVEYGMNDTVWRDSFISWLEENLNKI